MDIETMNRSLLFLYSEQTDREKTRQLTGDLNGKGFNRIDAAFLSSLAEQVQNGRKLSPKQSEVVIRRLKKYKNQLVKAGIIKKEEKEHGNSRL
jgi:hypothetical protein